MPDPRITWRLGVDDKVSRALRGIDSRIGGLAKSFRTLGGLTALAGLGTAAVRLTGQVADLAGQLQDASDKLGISAEELQRLKGAAEATGASFDQIQTALVFLAKRTGEAVRGGKEAAQAFAQLGIDAAKLVELPLDRRLAVIAAQLQKLPVGAARADLAVKVLGRGAGGLLPLLGDLDTELAKINVTLSNEQVAALDDASDAWERFKTASVVNTGKALGNLILLAERAGARIRDIPLTGALPGAVPVFFDAKPRGTGRPGGGGSRSSLSADEAAVIIGAPTTGDIENVVETVRRSAKGALLKLQTLTDEVDVLFSRTSQQSPAVLELGEKFKEAARLIDDSRPPIERYRLELERIQKLEEEFFLTADEAVLARKKAYEDLASTAKEQADLTDDTTKRLLEDIKTATQGFASDLTDIFFDSTQSIGEMFANLAKQIAKTLLQVNVIQPLVDALGGLFGGGPELIDMSKLPQRRAGGGSAFGGSPYLVGENGPELFVPRRSGTVVSNNALTSAGTPVTLNMRVLDTQSGVAWLAANEHVLVNLIRRAQARAGRTAVV